MAPVQREDFVVSREWAPCFVNVVQIKQRRDQQLWRAWFTLVRK
jgi:hypothetical protein